MYVCIHEDGSVAWHKALCSKWSHILLGLSHSSGGGSFLSLAIIPSLLYAICSVLSCLIVPVTFLFTQSLATITVHVHSSTCSLAFLLEISAVEDETSMLSWGQEKLPTDLVWFFFSHGATAPSGPWSHHYQGFTITFKHTTLNRTPLDEWSAQCRDLYLTTHNTPKTQAFMPLVWFKPTVPASEWPQTYTLDCVAIGISALVWCPRKVGTSSTMLQKSKNSHSLMLLSLLLFLFLISFHTPCASFHIAELWR